MKEEKEEEKQGGDIEEGAEEEGESIVPGVWVKLGEDACVIVRVEGETCSVRRKKQKYACV